MWIFTEKVADTGKIKRSEPYGSVRALCNNEKIVIGNKVKNESQVRHLLKVNNDLYEDDRYRIEKKETVRSKQFPI